MFSQEIKKFLTQASTKLQISVSEDKILLEHPAELTNGDYSTNIALVTAKTLDKKPRDLADKIVSTWREIGLPDFVEKIEVAGPGFINIWLKFGALGNELIEVLKDGDGYGRGLKPARTKDSNVLADFSLRQKTIVIDYSAPNIAKPFGIGHLRSTNIGQALYNLYKFLGWKVIGDNHLGDWGTQFGKLVYQIELKIKRSPIKSPNILDHPLIKNLTLEDLEKLYVEFHKEAETHPEMEDEARKWFKKLEEGDPEAKGIWQACIDISMKEFDRIYNLLGVKIDFAHGESFYLDKMDEVLEDCRKKGILKESQGAQVVEVPGMEVPAMLVKSDGATTYLLRDLATIKFRMREWKADLIVYEVGADQTMHFQQLFNVATQLGYAKLNQFVHVAHGLIRWSSGKFSTRKGMTIHLEEVLDEAIKKAEKLCESAGVAKDLTPEERAAVAQKIGIGAIKYNDLKQNPRTDIVFDWEQILSLQGNSGPYLQYTYARTESILKKSGKHLGWWRGNDLDSSEVNPEEGGLLRTIYRFPEVVEEAAKTYSPNLICNFLFDLSQKFNLFYDKQRIIGSENEEFRLLLTAAVGQVLKNGLRILGIEALEKM